MATSDTEVRGRRSAGCVERQRMGSPLARAALACVAALLLLMAGSARAVGFVSFQSTPYQTWNNSTGALTATLQTPITPPTGYTNLLMAVVVTVKFASGPLNDASQYSVTGTFGSANVVQAAMTGGASASPSAAVWIGYVKAANLGAAGTLTVNLTSAVNMTGAELFAGFFSNVSQQWSIADSSSKNANATSAAVPAAIYGPGSGEFVAAAASPSAAPTISSGYTSGATDATYVGSQISYKTATASDTPSASVTTAAALALASIALNPDTYPPVTIGDGTPGSIAPMVAILNPYAPADSQAIVSPGVPGVKVQARVFSPKNGTNTQAISSVKVYVDGLSTPMSQNPNFGTATDSGIFETTVPSTSLPSGSHTIQVEAANPSGTVRSSLVNVTVPASGLKGDGYLLVRDNSNMLCMDCHNLPLHSSETAGNALGSWAVVCRDCHTPHSTKNIFLVRPKVTPPSITKPAVTKPVTFYTTTGFAANGFLSSTFGGMCQVCHTRTTDSVGNPMFRNNAGYDATHNTSQACMGCHGHATGFHRPANVTCYDCHGTNNRTDGLANAETPPKDTCGNTQGRVASLGNGPNRVGAHLEHLGGNTKQFSAGIPCAECHVDPPLRAGHDPGNPGNTCQTSSTLRANGGDFTSFWGTIAKGGTGWGGTASPTYDYTTQTCGSVYCHGNFRNSGVASPQSVTWNGTVACGGCHKNSNGTSAAPVFPHPARASDLTGTTCADCHPSTSLSGGGWTTHVNGTLNQSSYLCSQCHGLLTSSPGVSLSANPYDAAPGYTASASSKDVAGNTLIGTAAVGAHLSHLKKINFRSSPIECTECHALPPSQTDTGHATGAGTGGARATLTWGSLSKGTILGWTSVTPTYTGSNTGTFTSPSYGTTPGTCATVYCHGAFPNGPNSGTGYSRTWNGSFSSTLTSTTLSCAPGAGLNSCHGSGTDAQPSSAPHTPGALTCSGCHDAAYSWNNTTLVGTVSPTLHINGKAEASGGDCMVCHASQKGSIPRAKIVGGAAGSEGDDFIRKSRHVSNGTTNSIVTNYDCILCHTEGDITSAGTTYKTVLANHGGDGGTTTVDLRNVDSVGGTGIAVAWPGKRLSTFTATPTQRDGMDSFCMGCHDSDGASQVAVGNGNPPTGMICSNVSTPCAQNVLPSTVTRTNYTAMANLRPFNQNDTLQNANEPTTTLWTGQTPIPTWRASNNRLINVKGDGGSLVGFNSGNKVGTNWASHHNLNQFTKRYSTNNTGVGTGIWRSYTTKDSVQLSSTGWTTGLHCSDCHLNETNAHGSRSGWYMLSDSTGADGAGSNSGSTTTSNTDICNKCHNPWNSLRYKHNRETRMLQGGYKANALGVSAVGATTEHLVCMGCHGGNVPGAIHGVNGTYKPWNGTVVSKQYRFHGVGGTWRWYSPYGTTGSGYTGDSNWETSLSAVNCYTLGGADTWGGCTQHGSGTSETNTTYFGTGSRPLNY